MKKGDILWLAALVVVLAFILSPITNPIFISFTKFHPYLSGFAQFFILATMGELLTLRIVKKNWVKPHGLIYRMLVWGVIGITISLMFEVFAVGVVHLLNVGMLPGKGNKLAASFFTSLIANLSYGPTFMGAKQISDVLIDKRVGEKVKISILDAARCVDWGMFLKIAVFITLICVMTPVHTVTFMLPEEYRVFMAAVVSIIIGVLLAIPGQLKAKEKSR